MPDSKKEVPKKAIKVVKLTPEQIASRERAHELKVVKFLTGGKF